MPHNGNVASRTFQARQRPRTCSARQGVNEGRDRQGHHIEAEPTLRAAGLKQRPSSLRRRIPKEYFAPNTRHLQNDIAGDLAAVGMELRPKLRGREAQSQSVVAKDVKVAGVLRRSGTGALR